MKKRKRDGKYSTQTVFYDDDVDFGFDVSFPTFFLSLTVFFAMFFYPNIMLLSLFDLVRFFFIKEKYTQ